MKRIKKCKTAKSKTRDKYFCPNLFMQKETKQKKTHTANWKAIMQLPFSLTAPRHVTINDKSRIVSLFSRSAYVFIQIVFFFVILFLYFLVCIRGVLLFTLSIRSSWGVKSGRRRSNFMNLFNV